MQLEIYNDYHNTIFPDHEGNPSPMESRGRKLKGGIKDIELVQIKVNPELLIADFIWDLMKKISLPDGVYSDYGEETWWDMVNLSFFPPFGLLPYNGNHRLYPYLKKIEELEIADGDRLILVLNWEADQSSIPKEFNAMSEHDIKLLDKIFRWVPEKLDHLIENIVLNNDLKESVDKLTECFVKGTGIIRDEADKKRYIDTFRRIATYRVVEPTMKPSREKYEKEKNYYWLYLISKIEKRCREGQKEILKEISSFTKKDVDWLADKGYLGKVKR
jgi:hypothetical protein